MNGNLPAKYVTLMSNLRMSTHWLEIQRGSYTKITLNQVIKDVALYVEQVTSKKFIFKATVRAIKTFDQSVFVT